MRAFAAVYLKKQCSLLNEADSVLLKLQPYTVLSVKNALLACLENEKSASQRHLLCEVMGEIAGSMIKHNQWIDLIPYFFNQMGQSDPHVIAIALK